MLRVPADKIVDKGNLPFLLILDHFTISRGNTSASFTPMPVGGMMMGGGGYSFDYLSCIGTFMLWDNVNGKIVSFGKLNEAANGSLFSSRKTWWGNLAKKVSAKIFLDKPYGKPSQQEE